MHTTAIQYIAQQCRPMLATARELEAQHMNSDCTYDNLEIEKQVLDILALANDLQLLCSDTMQGAELFNKVLRGAA